MSPFLLAFVDFGISASKTAEVIPSPDMNAIWPVLVNFGIGGIVLGWFMFKSEPRLRGIEASIDRMARAILLLVVSLPNATLTAKHQAEGIGAELDEAQRVREGK